MKRPRYIKRFLAFRKIERMFERSDKIRENAKRLLHKAMQEYGPVNETIEVPREWTITCKQARDELGTTQFTSPPTPSTR